MKQETEKTPDPVLSRVLSPKSNLNYYLMPQSNMLCPRCDHQGTVVAVRINATGEVVWLCDECDALWPSNVPITQDNFVDFASYVKPLGLNGRWSEVTVLDEKNGILE
jgi:hypothetical protein